MDLETILWILGAIVLISLIILISIRDEPNKLKAIKDGAKLYVPLSALLIALMYFGHYVLGVSVGWCIVDVMAVGLIYGFLGSSGSLENKHDN